MSEDSKVENQASESQPEISRQMGSCWTKYSSKAKECRRCAIMLKCAEATTSVARRVDAAKKPDCSPFEYMLSLFGHSMSIENRMIEGCFVYVFKDSSNGEPKIAVIVDKRADSAHEKITITANDGRPPIEFEGIESYEKASEIVRRFVS